MKDGGTAHREREAERRRQQSAGVREVGPLPAVVDPERRERGRVSLESFCAEYFPARFFWPFAPRHRDNLARMQRCTDEGGRFAVAEPRGDGKTARAECAVLHAVLYGFRRFVLLVQANETLAVGSLKKLQRELETNDRLAEDFPEVCHPIRSLERIHNRAKGQTLNGEATRIEWTANGVTLPTVAGSASSGAVIRVAGLTGAIRGLSSVGLGGEILRPDLVVIDDAQTRESAKSPVQTADREAIVTDDILGLAGPGTEIAVFFLCTVIYPNDLSDRFLDHDRHPDWQGVRTRLLETFPSDLDLWDRYSEERRDGFRSGDRGERANAFYVANRAALDAGAAVSWEERKKPGEVSAIQSAMNLFLTNPRGFRAEYQNDPEPPDGGYGSAKELLAANVAGRLSGLPRQEVPREATRLTAMIDCGAHVLWYAVCAWDRGFGGSVIDYGTWPRQNRSHFAASDPRPGLGDLYRVNGQPMTESERLYAGLRDLTGEILGRVYYRETSGEELRIERCLIDAGWLPAPVYQFVRQSPHSGTIYPSKGIGRTATARGVSEWRSRPGERSGHHWRLTVSETGRGRMVQFDPDAWKTFVYDRLTAAPGGRGHLGLFGRKASDHEMIAAHCCAEYAEPVTIRGATLDKWQIKPHAPDNHLWDCLVGCAVAASVQGQVWDSGAAVGEPIPVAGGARPISLKELRQRQIERKRGRVDA